jgi:hypothetical protein
MVSLDSGLGVAQKTPRMPKGSAWKANLLAGCFSRSLYFG